MIYFGCWCMHVPTPKDLGVNMPDQTVKRFIESF